MKKFKPGQLLTYNNNVYQIRRSKNGVGCNECDYDKNILNEPLPCLKCVRVPDDCYLENVSPKHIYTLNPLKQRGHEVTVKLNHSCFILLLRIRNLCKHNFTCSFLKALEPIKFEITGTKAKRRLPPLYLVELIKKLSEEYETLNIR